MGVTKAKVQDFSSLHSKNGKAIFISKYTYTFVPSKLEKISYDRKKTSSSSLYSIKSFLSLFLLKKYCFLLEDFAKREVLLKLLPKESKMTKHVVLWLWIFDRKWKSKFLEWLCCCCHFWPDSTILDLH